MWYRAPTILDEHPAYRNDIIDIIPDGRIMFDRMSDEPGGELHRQDIMLNSTNFMRMKGFWDLMPNASNYDQRLRELRCWYSNDMFRCAHGWRALSTGGPEAVGEYPPPAFKGIWYRLLGKRIADHNDVVKIDPPRRPIFYALPSQEPGRIRRIFYYKSEIKRRLVGAWFRLPAASVEINQRRDEMIIKVVNRRLHYVGYQHAADVPIPGITVRQFPSAD
ncbi:hypothetical protein AX14_002796 [Amanita brunnescens Koide BX004]|nr:hypothetical protein AX14_002796 [Amanita brunnescens Koide BX004]